MASRTPACRTPGMLASVGLFVVAWSAPASGAYLLSPGLWVEEQTVSAPFGATPSSADEVLLAPFDDANGTRELIGLRITADATASLDAAIENRSTEPTSDLRVALTPVITALVDVGLARSFIGATLGETPVVDALLNLGPADGSAGSGPDFVDFGRVTGPVSESAELGPTSGVPDLFEVVAGMGEVKVTVRTGQSLTFPDGFPTGTMLRPTVENYAVTGLVRLTYIYEVPGAGSWAIGLAGLVVVVRRKR
mgnify:CR=1 FL=1